MLLAVLSACSAPRPAAAPEPSSTEPELTELRAENARLNVSVQLLQVENRALHARPAPDACITVPPEAATSAELAVSSSGEGAPVLAAREVGVPAAAPLGAATALPLLRARGQVESEARGLTQPPDVDAPVLLSGGADAADFDAGREAHERGDHLRTESLLTRFLQLNPRHPFADDALFYRGQSRLARKQEAAAESDFRTLVERYPDEMDTPAAWLELGRILESRGDAAGARQAYMTILQKHAQSAAASLVPPEYLP
jgi:TolA-binding protein